VLDPLGEGLHLVVVGDAVEEHRELVPADARHGVAGSEPAREPLGHPHEQAVARLEPEAVVHGLEPVDVHHQHGDAPPGRLGAHLQGLAQAVEEDAAVGEAGEGVPLDAARDVAGIEDEPAHVRVVEAVRHQRLDVDVGPVLALHAVLDPHGGALLPGAPVDHLLEAGEVVGVHGRPRLGPPQLARFVAEDPVDAPAEPLGRARQGDDREHVERVARDGPEPSLAPLKLAPLAGLFGDVPDREQDARRSPLELAGDGLRGEAESAALAVFVAASEAQGAVRVGAQLAELLEDPDALRRVHAVEEGGADQLRGLEPEAGLAGLPDEADVAHVVQHEEDVGRLLRERTEQAPLAPQRCGEVRAQRRLRVHAHRGRPPPLVSAPSRTSLG